MEIWKDIKGLEGKYQISDLGNVKALSFTGIRKDGRKYHVVENIKKQSIFNNGYYGFGTNRDHGTILLHRALAEAFIPNPENKRCVNHKDGNKLNNSLDNLEWATHGENNQHAYDTKLKVPSDKLRNNSKQLMISNRKDSSKIVINTLTGIFYDSIKEAAKSIDMNQNLLQCRLLGRTKNLTPFIYA